MTESVENLQPLEIQDTDLINENLDPRVLFVCEHDLKGKRKRNSRLILALLGQNAGKAVSMDEIDEAFPELRRRHIHKLIEQLLLLAEKYCDSYGFSIIKSKRPRKGKWAPNEVLYTLNLSTETTGRTDRESRLIVSFSGEEVCDITAEMRRCALAQMPDFVDKERCTRQSDGIPVLETWKGQEEYIENLFANSSWVIRRDQPEYEVVKRFIDTGLESGPKALRSFELLREFDITQKTLMHYIERRMLKQLLELGFMIARVDQGYFAPFVLEEEAREIALLKKYPSEEIGDNELSYFDKVHPFSRGTLTSRLYPRRDAKYGDQEKRDRLSHFSPLQLNILKKAVLGMHNSMQGRRETPFSAQEIAKALGVKKREIYKAIKEMEAMRYQTGMYVRFRNDKKIEPVALCLDNIGIREDEILYRDPPSEEAAAKLTQSPGPNWMDLARS